MFYRIVFIYLEYCVNLNIQYYFRNKLTIDEKKTKCKESLEYIGFSSIKTENF